MLMGLGPTGAAGQEEFCATTGHQTTGDSFLDDGFSAGIRFVIAGLHTYFKWVLENNKSQTLLDRTATSTETRSWAIKGILMETYAVAIPAIDVHIAVMYIHVCICSFMSSCADS